jgi:hypothetical protein
MFVAAGLILIFGIIGGAALAGVLKKMGAQYQVLGDFDSSVLIAIFVVIAALLAFIYYFLFQFSQKIKAGLLSEDMGVFNNALKSLKTFFIITTVISILSLVMNIYNLF